MINKTLLLAFLLLLPITAYSGPLDFAGSWTTDSGAKAKLADWKGQKVVLAMLYPRCTSACPFLLEKLRQIQKRLDVKKEKATFLAISFDSRDESAARLHEYREHAQLTGENWHFLFGSERDVRFFSNLVNVRFSRNPKTNEFSHDNVILLIDEKGVIKRRLEGLDASLEELF